MQFSKGQLPDARHSISVRTTQAIFFSLPIESELDVAKVRAQLDAHNPHPDLGSLNK